MAQTGHALVVAAIDFGTTFSGYAFSFRHEFETDPLRVNSSQWSTGSRVSISLKTSTCVLFGPDRRFHSFGFEAEDKYSDLSYDGEHTAWYYFRRFKMLLYDTGVPLLFVRSFSFSVEYLFPRNVQNDNAVLDNRNQNKCHLRLNHRPNSLDKLVHNNL